METVVVEGSRIGYERVGDGPPVLLLHGYVGDGPTTWRRQLEALRGEFTPIACDAPGAGRSSDPPETFEMEIDVSTTSSSMVPWTSRPSSLTRSIDWAAALTFTQVLRAVVGRVVPNTVMQHLDQARCCVTPITRTAQGVVAR